MSLQEKITELQWSNKETLGNQMTWKLFFFYLILKRKKEGIQSKIETTEQVEEQNMMRELETEGEAWWEEFRA